MSDDLHLTTYNTHKKQTFMTPAGFEQTIPGSEGPQIHALYRAVTGTGILTDTYVKYVGNRNIMVLGRYCFPVSLLKGPKKIEDTRIDGNTSADCVC